MSVNPRVSIITNIINNGTRTYLYEAHKLVGEYDENGDVIKEYLYYGDTPLAVITDTHKIYADHLDTPRRAADNTNTIVWTWESKPFGEDKPTGSYTLNLRFPGQYFDTETRTHYNINRDYSPVTGRYIQSDPIGFEGGVNTYLYANGNGVRFVDEEGLIGFTIPKTKSPVAALASAITGVITYIGDVAGELYDKARLHRGRIQIQSKSYESSIPWASTRAPTKKEGRQALAVLEDELFIKNSSMYFRLTNCGAFDRAVRFINSGPIFGIGSSKSINCSNQYNSERIDFEIINGQAFID